MVQKNNEGWGTRNQDNRRCALVQLNVILLTMPIGPKSARANLTLDAELLVAAKIEAAKENKSLSKWVMAAMRAALSKRKGA